jgi:hypothetical protein
MQAPHYVFFLCARNALKLYGLRSLYSYDKTRKVETYILGGPQKCFLKTVVKMLVKWI